MYRSYQERHRGRNNSEYRPNRNQLQYEGRHRYSPYDRSNNRYIRSDSRHQDGWRTSSSRHKSNCNPKHAHHSQNKLELIQRTLATRRNKITREEALEIVDLLKKEQTITNLGYLCNNLKKLLNHHSFNDYALILRNVAININKYFLSYSSNRDFPKHISLIANAFSRLPLDELKKEEILETIKQIAQHIKIEKELEKLDSQAISNIANCFAKLPLDELKKEEILETIKQIAKHITKTGKLQEFKPQAISNIANCFAKLPLDKLKEGEILETIKQIAKHIAKTGKLQEFKPQAISNIANCFAKLPLDKLKEGEILETIKQIAKHIAKTGKLQEFKPLEISNIANCFAKLPLDKLKEGEISETIKQIAKHITKTGKLQEFKPLEISNIANCFAKLSLDELKKEEILEAIKQIATHITKTGKLQQFKPQAISNIANCFAKLPLNELKKEEILEAIKQIAQHIKIGKELEKLDSQAISNIANCFAKLPLDELKKEEILEAIKQIAKHITKTEKLQEFKPLEISNIANCFAKLPLDKLKKEEILEAIKQIAKHITKTGKLQEFKPQAISNIANCFAKLPLDELKEGEILETIKQIAQHITKTGKLQEFKPQAISNIANCFAKLPLDKLKEGEILETIKQIAQHITKTGKLQEFKPLEISNIINCFAKLPLDELKEGEILEAIKQIAQHITKTEKLQEFDTQAISNIANCFVKLPEEGLESKVILNTVTIILGYVSKNIDNFNLQDLGQIIYLLSNLPNAAAFKGHIDQVVGKIHEICKKDDFTLNNDNYSEMVIFLYFSKRFCHYRNTHNSIKGNILSIYDKVIPKLIEYWKKDDFVKDEQYLKHLYFIAAAIDRALLVSNKTGPRYQRLVDNLIEIRSLFKEYGEINLNLSHQNLNVIALLQREEGVGNISDISIIDEMMRKNKFGDLSHNSIADDLGIWSDVINPNQMQDQDDDVQNQGFELLSNVVEIKPYTPNIINIKGNISNSDIPSNSVAPSSANNIANDNEMVDDQNSFSLLHQLTGLEFAKVKLPFKVDERILGRIIEHNGEKYRIDCFGGSAMKESRDDDKHSTLIAIKLGDSCPDSDFHKIVSDLFTFKESFYYFQRAFNPTIKAEDVLHSKNSKITVFKDTDGDHPFKIKNPYHQNNSNQTQYIDIKPHDGFGFIKKSAVKDLGLEKDFHQFGQREGNLSYQGLLHFKPNEDLIDELKAKGRESLESELQQEDPDNETIYRSLIVGNNKVHNSISCPIMGEDVIFPQQGIQQSTQGITIGRSPYNKTNLIAIDEDNVKRDDDNANFLKSMQAIQYSMLGEIADIDQNKQRSFFKGMLGIIPDELWPEEYQDSAIVTSAEDQKLSSNWIEQKQKVGSNNNETEKSYQFNGILAATDRFDRGSLIGVPTKIQKTLGGDFDGDHNNIIENLPQLIATVKNPDNEVIKGLQEITTKPPKEFTKARDEEGNYQFSRAEQIAKIQKSKLGGFTSLLSKFLQLEEQERVKISQEILTNIFQFNYDDNEDIMSMDTIIANDDQDEETLIEFIQRCKIEIPDINEDDEGNEITSITQNDKEIEKCVASILALCINICTDIYKAGTNNIDKIDILFEIIQDELSQIKGNYISKSIKKKLDNDKLDPKKEMSPYSIPGQVYNGLIADYGNQISPQNPQKPATKNIRKRKREEEVETPNSTPTYPQSKRMKVAKGRDYQY